MSLRWEKFRQVRKEKGLTIQNLAQKSGISPSLISQIERGIVDPTVTNFWKLCQGLDVSIHTFFESEERDLVIRNEDRKAINFRMANSEVRYQLLSPNKNASRELLLIEIDPGKKADKDFISHKGEEWGFVIDGEILVHLEDKVYHLKQGDSISFKSTIPHRFENCSSQVSRSIWAMTPDTL